MCNLKVCEKSGIRPHTFFAGSNTPQYADPAHVYVETTNILIHLHKQSRI